MVVLNYTGGEVNAKIVYYGPGLSGKTTNLEFIHDRTPEGSRGKMVSMKTQTDRTLFFDFLPLELGEIGGYRTRFLLYTVPGQVYYNATRKLVLKGVDAVVFVADSSRAKLDENLESLRNLEQNLNEHGMSLDEIPWVIQYNKRDCADAMAPSDLDARLNPLRVPSYEAVATLGKGVYETFHGIATLVYRILKERLERGDLAAEAAAAGAPAQVRPAPAPQPARAAAPARQPAGASNDFEYDIDSMLREMDAPAPRPNPAPAPAARATNVYGTVNTSPAPPAPVATSVDAKSPIAAERPTPAPAATALRAAEQTAPAAKKSLNDSGVFERQPEPFDHELGRLPALEDAAVASETARHEGPNEFVTDPMRRPLVADVPAAPKGEALPVDAVAPKPPMAPMAPMAPMSPLAPEPTTITVPVVVSRDQLRSGSPLRVLLEIHVKDE